MRISRTLPFALLLSFFAGACGATKLTPQQEFTMALFAECRTRTNAINVRLDQVYPDGSWSATVNQTQSEYNYVVACMKDPTVRATIYRREADSGNAMAMADLGQMYEFGDAGLPKDDAEAVQWYRRGAEAGSGQAMASLGHMYERGRGGLAKDIDAAGQWYRKGAGTGDRFAMYYMGRACEFGLGVPKDRAEAAQWYQKSAAAGFTPAADRLKKLAE
jgi:TPR repeat protein